jgi:hypothetical protein
MTLRTTSQRSCWSFAHAWPVTWYTLELASEPPERERSCQFKYADDWGHERVASGCQQIMLLKY